MNAAEIIEMIKKLPPEERAEVLAFIQREQGPRAVEETASNVSRATYHSRMRSGLQKVFLIGTRNCLRSWLSSPCWSRNF